jgi:fibronectin-binding autotransporter adhesin
MATITYTGDGNTSDWSDGANWKGGVAPGASDSALLVGGAASTVTDPVAVNNIMLLAAQSVTFQTAVTTYGLGACKGLMVCEGGTITFGPGSSLTDGGVLQAGLDATGTIVATGTVADPTTLQAERTQLGKNDGGVGFMTIDGATLANSSHLVVGQQGEGTLNVLDGGQVTASDLTVGLDAGASGSVDLSSGGTISVAGNASIGGWTHGGVGGTGAVTVGSGSLLHAAAGVQVEGGSSLVLAGGTVEAGDTKGGIDIRAGGSVSGDGILATHGGGWFEVDGTVTASGGELDLTGNLGGAGTLAIGDGSTIAIDSNKVSTATITFAGAGAAFDLNEGAAVTSALTGFAIGDAIQMAGVTAAAWNSADDILTMSGVGGQTIGRLHLAGSYSADQFVVTQQNGIGVITLQHQ